MARNSKVGKKASSRKPRAVDGKGRPRRGRPKVCRFCADHTVWVDYKDVNVLGRFLNDRGRIKSRGSTGTCAQHQRDVAVAIKTARELALLPYAVRTVAADPGDRRRGGRGGVDRKPRSDETEGPQAAGSEEDAEDIAADDAADDVVDDAAEPETETPETQPSPETSTVAATS